MFRPWTQQNITFCLASWGTRHCWVQAAASTLETWFQNKLLLFHLNFISRLHLSLLLSRHSQSIFPSYPTSRMTKPCKSSLTPCSVIWSRFSVVIFPLLKMILILNDTAHCWENETSVAASPFECPCEFIKSTSFPRFQLQILHSCTSMKEKFKDKKSLTLSRMPYHCLCSTLQFTTMSWPKYLLWGWEIISY